MTGDNPDTYGWYQCDEEDYDSGTPPEEQAGGERTRALIDELAAFDAAYLAEHGVYPAVCDLPEHLIGVAGIIEQEQDDFDPNGPERDPLPPALSFDW